MEKYDIYQDIAKRTDGDIYLGVVGPVRTGKSTFVRRFAETTIVPNITGKNKKTIATDELPQAGAGRTVTTTEPKFIPGEAVKVTLKGKTHANMRLIDCVGFMVDGALGHEEDGSPRMVKTPWSKDPVPFEEAAETGTDKVINEHSTIGVVVTTDGSITDIPRENYVAAERKTIEKLKRIGKPFAIVLNSKDPAGEACASLSEEMEKEYGVSVVRMNVSEDGEGKFAEVLEKILSEFPVKQIDVNLPDYVAALPLDSRLVSEIAETVRAAAAGISKMKDCVKIEEAAINVEKIIPEGTEVFAGEGRALVNLGADKSLFYDLLSETCGEAIDGEYRLMSFVRDLSAAKREYDRVRNALEDAEENGYGIVLPTEKEVVVGEPSLVKQGGRYEVKIEAETESLHVVKVGVKASVSPISGTKKQCEEFIGFIRDSDGDLAEANVFGKPLGDLVLEEVSRKTGAMPEFTREKLRKSVTKMVNGGKYRLIYFVY